MAERIAQGSNFREPRSPTSPISLISPSPWGSRCRPPMSQITSPHIRRIVTVHCIAGFFFNLGVLALTINVLASGASL